MRVTCGATLVFRFCGVAGTLVLLAVAGCVTPPAQSSGRDADDKIYTIDLQVGSVAGLPKCNAGLAGVTAFVESPPSLWSCNGAWIRIPCTNLLAGAVAYASATQTLYACVSGEWTVVPLPTGPRGPEGPQGDAGQPGPAGTNGVSSLITTTSEPPGQNCKSGGVKITVGADRNASGAIDEPDEVISAAYVCNGDGVARCGDGVIQTGEECDSGNTLNAEPVDTATCTKLCKLSVCGDGYVNAAAGEPCDTGGVDTAACNAPCTVSSCGDGYLNAAAGEECDDGNGMNLDACGNTCKAARCGDGLVQLNESCDTRGMDTAACNGATCRPSFCGDGYLNAADGERCDDGNHVDGDGCSNHCVLPTCGDGVLQSDEQCDTSGVDTADCNAKTCKMGRCGDGYINHAAGEVCEGSGSCAENPAACGGCTRIIICP
jgi:cysteine-rich repeat protein